MSETPREVVIRRVSDHTVVRRIPWSATTAREHEKAMRGLLRNMSDDYFADDSAMDFLYREGARHG